MNISYPSFLMDGLTRFTFGNATMDQLYNSFVERGSKHVNVCQYKCILTTGSIQLSDIVDHNSQACRFNHFINH